MHIVHLQKQLSSDNLLPKTNGNNPLHVSRYYKLHQFPNARTNASCNELNYPGNLFAAPVLATIQNLTWMAQRFFFQRQSICDCSHTMLLQNMRCQLRHREPVSLLLSTSASNAAGCPFEYACHIYAEPAQAILPRMDFARKVSPHIHACYVAHP